MAVEAEVVENIANMTLTQGAFHNQVRRINIIDGYLNSL